MADIIPQYPPESAPEHVKAKYWREHIVRLSRPKLAEMIGMSVSSIADIETGHNRSTKAVIDGAVMQRYRMCCAAVMAGIEFDWFSVSLIPDVPVQIRMFHGRK